MTIIGIEGGFSRDHLVHVEHGARFDVPGGPGLYASLAADLTLRWLAGTDAEDAGSSRVRVFGAGADEAVVAALAEAGIDTGWLAAGSPPRLWLLTSAAGRRIVSADRHPGHELGDASAEYEPEPLSPHGFHTGLDALLRCAPTLPGIVVEPGTLVAVDPDQRQIAAHGWSYFEELARTATLFLPSRVQLSQLHHDPVRAATELRERTGRAVVARIDADGCYALPLTGEIWHVAAASAAVVDPTGAGDSHAAALLTALAMGRDLPEAAAVASIVAARTVGDWGSSRLQGDPLCELGDPDAAISTIPITPVTEGASS